MGSSALADVLRHLRHQLAAQQSNEDSDEQLLDAFTSRRDEAAFAMLMRRYGSMVLHVCRRVLGHEQDAEDAFQATFLVLAQSAAAVRNRTSLASFLHGVAYRTALKAKHSVVRRRKNDGQAPSRPPIDPADELSWREVRLRLDEEIGRLPEIYRSVFVLCVLEGVSREETARRLGLKPGTVSSRLTAARKRLARRLARRGIELTAVLAATSLATSSASALPAGLISTTMKAALATAAGEGLNGVISASVAELVQGMTATVLASKAKITTVILLTVTLLSGAGVKLLSGGRQPPTAPRSTKHETAKTVQIHVRVFAPDGKPKAGAKLLLLSEDKKITELGVAAADGRFSVSVPNRAEGLHLMARSDDAGFDAKWISNSEAEKPVELHLVKDQPIRGRVLNTEGKPLAGVRVAVKDIDVYPNNSLDWFLDYWKNRQIMENPLGGDGIGNAAGVLFATATDVEGRFVLRGLGVERFVTLHLQGKGIAETELWIMTRPGFDPKPINKMVRDNTPKDVLEQFGNGRQLHGSDVTVVAEAEKIIRGSVKEADTGKARANVRVHLFRPLEPDLEVRTDAEGRYEFRGARKTKSYMLEVQSDPATSYMGRQIHVDDTPGYQPVTADIAVKKGVLITGKMIDQTTGKPMNGLVRIAALKDNTFVKEYPGLDSAAWNSVEVTDANGVFRVVAIPGPVLLMGNTRVGQEGFQYKNSVVEPKYRQYFRVTPNSVAYYRPDGGWSSILGIFFKVLEIEPDANIVEQDIVLERLPALTVQMQDGDGKPLTQVFVAGQTGEGHYPIQFAESHCTAFGVQPSKPRLMIFYHSTRKLAAAITLKGDEKQPVAVKLGAVGTIKGRLIDTDGKPLADMRVYPNYYHRSAAAMHRCIHLSKQIVTDAEGHFTFDDVIPGFKFELSFRRGRQRFEHEIKPTDPAIQVKPGERRDLGAIKLKRTAG